MLERGARSRSVPVPRFRKSFAQSNTAARQLRAPPTLLAMTSNIPSVPQPQSSPLQLPHGVVQDFAQIDN
jgi:hypothetical protein